VTTYRSTFGPGTVGGVDHNGDPHDPLVFDDQGYCTVPDDQQEYVQTLNHLLDTGQIARSQRKTKGN